MIKCLFLTQIGSPSAEKKNSNPERFKRGKAPLDEAGRKGSAAMRGDGSIYPRGNVLWIAYSFRRQIFRESSHTDDEGKARKLLKQRLKQVERPGFVGPKEDKWTLVDMKARIEADYDRKENRY